MSEVSGSPLSKLPNTFESAREAWDEFSDVAASDVQTVPNTLMKICDCKLLCKTLYYFINIVIVVYGSQIEPSTNK